MKPGARTSPRASTRTAASRLDRSPIASIRTPFTATSATKGGAPLPSTIFARSTRIIAATRAIVGDGFHDVEVHAVSRTPPDLTRKLHQSFAVGAGEVDTLGL